MAANSENAQQAAKGELSVLTMSDDQIMNKIHATHDDHADETFDPDSLFIVAQNILKRATHIVDNMVQGSQPHDENLEEKAPSFSPPALCTLKQLSFEMACKTPGEQTAEETTMSILNKLKSYSWHAKAALTLAAFSIEYGDFWLLAQLFSSNQLASSVGILKRVPAILKRPSLIRNYRKEIVELNNLIKATMEVINSIFELGKLSIDYTQNVTASIAMGHLPVDVYWAIITIVACTTQMCCLTSDEDTTQVLSPFDDKIKLTLDSLTKQINLINQQTKEVQAYRRLKDTIGKATLIMKVLKALIFAEHNVQQLFDGSTQEWVSIDLLEKKNVLLFFSGLDISTVDISILKPINDGIRKDDQYKIIWIPIVEQWTDDLQKKFEGLQSQMVWYTLRYSAPAGGISFIKKKWKFENKPILVVMNPQGKVEHLNALHMIWVWGMRALPFTKAAEELLVKEPNWIGDIMVGIYPNLQDSMNDKDKHIFFYGGKEKESWIRQFEEKAAALKNDPVIKEARISIESFCIGKDSKENDDHESLGHFWKKIESLFFSKIYKDTNQDPEMQKIQKLLSFRNESEWVIVSNLSKVEVICHGEIILKFLGEFQNWKGKVLQKIGFIGCLKKYDEESHDEGVNRPCCHVDIPFTSGSIPKHMKCPHCARIMETRVNFKCCHIDEAI
ncbi:protein SIEVE ELEMENT OCCLUSION B-like [Alnus glutinosa]|uniref:protein SIEVE ELEMENT OCCLUSION B-like n=1 Tax=Alnus glutinosa TaxID=3517 RepID=UPI002D78E65B|nr:protein SIEVE ELEMENT OCCLUSION B-like [Alnus glutinosa]